MRRERPKLFINANFIIYFGAKNSKHNFFATFKHIGQYLIWLFFSEITHTNKQNFEPALVHFDKGNIVSILAVLVSF